MPGPAPHSAFEAPAGETTTGSAVLAPLRVFLIALACLAVAAVAIAGVYLMKSAMGIDLMPWRSPLHDLLYHLVG